MHTGDLTLTLTQKNCSFSVKDYRLHGVNWKWFTLGYTAFNRHSRNSVFYINYWKISCVLFYLQNEFFIN